MLRAKDFSIKEKKLLKKLTAKIKTPKSENFYPKKKLLKKSICPT